MVGEKFCFVTRDTRLSFSHFCFFVHTAVVGLLSMARGLSETVDSRFFVTLSPDAKWADGRYSAFGQLNQADESMQASGTMLNRS